MKNLIKTIFISLLIICMMSAAGVMASENIMSITPSFDVEKSELSVNVIIENEKGNIPLVLTVMKDGTLIDAQQILSGVSSDGQVTASFSNIPFENTAPSGDYDIYVSADYIGISQSVVYTHDGADKRFEALEGVNDAIDSGDTQAIIDAISYGKVFILGGDETLFDLSDEAKETFAKLLAAKGVYAQPEDYASDENVAIINASLSELAANYRELLVIAEAVDIKNVTKLDLWLEKYAELKGFYEEDDKTPYSEPKLGEHFSEAKSLPGICSKISLAAKTATDYDSLKSAMLTAGVLTSLEEANYYGIREIAESFDNLFTIDWTAFNDLSSADKTAVCQKLTSLKFDDVEDFSDSFNDAVKAQKQNSGGSSSGSGTGGSGKSNSKGGSVYVPPAGSSMQPSASGAYFTDLFGFEWAQDAIKYLYENKVVSGKGNGVFDPAAQVTRAEFVKMVVEAFDIPKASYSGNFDDVSANSWYAEYIAAASARGVVTGVDDTHFVPDAPVSRQDMIVLLYRAKSFAPSVNEKDVFTDSHAISDYAKSAVYALYEKGIISGSGNGTLEPLRSASRAEAAQMIYNVIMK